MEFNSAFKVLMLILGKKKFDASLEIIFYIRFEQTVILLVNTGSGLKSRMRLNFVNIVCSFWVVHPAS
jgi:ABC-type antimicrobial peptide transport system ATPase subunit